MNEFRRLISYIYEYEGKVKGKNVGFVKLEARNGLCKLNINVKKLYAAGSNMGVYLLSARREIFLGNLFLRNGCGEFRTVVQVSDIEESGETMDECYGLSIHEKNDRWREYTTIWEDSMAQAAQLALESAAPETSESAAAVPETSESAAAVSEASESVIAVPETSESAAAAPEVSESIAAVPEVSESVAAAPEVLESVAAAPEVSESEKSIWANRVPEAITADQSDSETPETGAAENIPDVQAEAVSDAAVMPLMEENSSLPDESTMKNTDAAPETESAHSSLVQPIARNRMPFPSLGRRAPAASSTMSRQNPSGTPPVMSRQNPSGTSPVMSRQTPQAASRHSQMTPAPVRQGPASARPEPIREYRHNQQNQQNIQNQQNLQNEEPLLIGDPEALERLEEEEQAAPVPLWDFLVNTYPKIQAFDSQYGCQVLVIKPQDIGLLPREVWVYGNNSFLLHGYYNYRYLILARLENPNGNPRYLLGVPGHYFSNEKYMASMFGFPHFVLSKRQQPQDGRFGYWYTDIRLENGSVPLMVASHYSQS